MTDMDITDVRDTAERGEPSFLVVDIGKKQRKKQIKRLRKGKGKLTRKIEEMLVELQASNTLPEGGTVVVVVREKQKKQRASRFFGL